MTWNIRLVEMSDENYPDEPYIEMREVFYDAMGKPLGHTAATVGGSDHSEIAQYIEWMQEALKKPVLKDEYFKGQF